MTFLNANADVFVKAMIGKFAAPVLPATPERFLRTPQESFERIEAAMVKRLRRQARSLRREGKA